MNELVVQNNNLPDTMVDLARFVLVGREKYNSVRAEIRAIDKLKLAEEVRNQKRQEAQMIAEAVLDAEVRLGELFKEIPKKQGGDRGNQYTGGKLRSESEYGKDMNKSKTEIVRDLGFSQDQAERLEKLAGNKDLVEFVKAEARENDDFPTRTRVLELAAYQKNQINNNEPRIIDITDIQQRVEEKCDEYNDFIDLRMNVYKELAKIIDLIDKFEITPSKMDALRDNFNGILRIDDHIRYINESIEKLNLIKIELWKGKKHGKKL